MPAAVPKPFDFQRYRSDGFFVWDGVFPADMLQRTIDRAMALPRARQGDFAPAMQAHREDPGFLELMRHPPVVEIVEALVGGTASGIQTQFFYMVPGTRGFSAHQDNFFVEAPSEAFVSVWVPLTDVDRANGTLILWPGSHRFGKLPVQKVVVTAGAGQDPNANNEETVIPAGLAPVDLVARKGSAVFIHSEVVHASHSNDAAAARYVQLNTYVLAGSPFRPGKHARRDEVSLHT
jgi:ectoine hydroxylase-related dioxygenase (phytanoyl-CoA dioxygenase family)